MELKEERAIPGLLTVGKMDIRVFQEYNEDDHFIIRNKAIIVGKAIEALLYISDGTYLTEVDYLIDVGLEKFVHQPYDQHKDNFSVIRYHLVSGLQYCPYTKIEELLETASHDPNESVRNLAIGMQARLQNAMRHSAYGRRRGTAIVDTRQGIIVVTHGNQFLLPGGSPKRGELQIQAAIRELREETGLRAYDVRYLFTHMAAKVFLIQAEGIPEPRNEIHTIEYYQEGSPVHVSNNTRLIIEKYWEWKKSVPQ